MLTQGFRPGLTYAAATRLWSVLASIRAQDAKTSDNSAYDNGDFTIVEIPGYC